MLMKNTLFAAALMAASANVIADPAAFVGFTYDLGGNKGFGLTAKVVSSDEENKNVGAVGFNYYLDAPEAFGVDVGVGRNFDNSGLILGYDVLNKVPTVSGGWVDTESKAPSGGGGLGGGV